jgi:beta-phosphoglucomutase-like phosphatase (HAD superfamily)
MKATLNAGMTLIGIPNPHFPPDEAVASRATAHLTNLADLSATLDALS